MIQVRSQHAELFGTGAFEVLNTENPSVLAYVRERVDEEGRREIVMCANNLSRFAQPVELHVAQYDGMHPVELIGRTPFPPIGELPYFLTLAPYGFFWFQLHAPAEDS
jgi:maltose alpha-D-glucosyltransferase/alpha-amylase